MQLKPVMTVVQGSLCCSEKIYDHCVNTMLDKVAVTTRIHCRQMSICMFSLSCRVIAYAD